MEISFGALLVFVANEFGIGYVFLGVIANALALGYGITAPIGGILSDRIGSKRMLAIQLGAAGVTGILVGFSTGPWFLATTLTLMGLAAGMYHPVGLSLITRGIRARTMATAYHGMAGSLAVAVAPGLAVVLAGLWNWRLGFLMYGVVGLTSATFVMFSKLDERRVDAGQAENPHISTKSAPSPTVSFLWLPLIAVFVVNALGGFIYRGAMTYLPLHFRDNLDLHLLGFNPETIAGYFATVALLFGVAGQYVGGFLGERVKCEVLAFVFGVLLIPPLFVMGMVGGIWLVFAASSFALFNFMTQPIYVSLIADYAPISRQGSMLGIMFLLSNGIGSFAATLGGFIVERGSTSQIFTILGALAAAVAAIAGFILISWIRRAKTAMQVRART
jgi:MFS family permease